MRVHGDKVIRRRKGIPELKKYQDGRERLEQDFHYLCGYCGKDGSVMHQKFHLDHFVPKSLDKSREKDYYNLVLACPRCNLSKSDQWPTGDIVQPHNGKEGFVDPAGSEFDEHLERNEKGYVVGKTCVGNSMCHMLHLDIRRTDLYWHAARLKRQLKELEKLFQEGKLTEQQKDIYIATNMIFNEYIEQAFIKGE